MAYRLSSSAKPNLLIQMDARHAESFRDAGVVAQRMMEITHGGRSMMGVLCQGKERLFGKMPLPGPVAGPLVESPSSLDGYGGSMTLIEQKAVVTAFRRVFAGSIRMAMSSLSGAFGDRTVYVAFHGLGAIAIVPEDDGSWSLAALRLEGARSMETERACAEVNRASLTTYSVIWRTISELQRRAEEERLRIEEEERQKEDRIDDDLLDGPPDPYGDPDDWRSSMASEEDEIDGNEPVEDAARDVPDPTDHAEPGYSERYDDGDGDDGEPRPRWEDDLDSVKF